MKAEIISRRCGYCKGAKKVRKSEFGITVVGCPICKATGTVNVPEDYTVCGQCDGTGKTAGGFALVSIAICDMCEGKGWAKPD